MKHRKRIIIFSVFVVLAIFSIKFFENNAKADIPPRIECKCTNFGKCKSDGTKSVCAQSEPGGNIFCTQYDSNCHIGGQ